MKSSFLIILTLLIAFSFSLCGSVLAVDDGSTDTGTDTPVVSEAPEAPAPSEAVTAAEADYTEVLGNIQGYLLFFVVVVLLYFSYKFFRMFF